MILIEKDSGRTSQENDETDDAEELKDQVIETKQTEPITTQDSCGTDLSARLKLVQLQ